MTKAQIESSFFTNKESICKGICPKCDAISLVRAKIECCFSAEAKEFAAHQSEEDFANFTINYCKKENISPDEFKEIILGFLYHNTNNTENIKQRYDKAIEFLKKKNFATEKETKI